MVCAEADVAVRGVHHAHQLATRNTTSPLVACSCVAMSFDQLTRAPHPRATMMVFNRYPP